jgi:myo-inositol-1(or 4)-monophosphatase
MSPPNLIELATRAAREAGAILRDYASRDFGVKHKGRIDLVTEVDLESERHIRNLITEYYPGHQILAEEGGASGGEGDYCWIIDPLDGTTNYAHRYPMYCVSIGVEHRGENVLGVVYDPNRDELFAAERGSGATLNGKTIGVSTVSGLEKSLVVSGFPYDVRERMSDYLPVWERFLSKAQAVRRDGAAALDMCYVAAGRFDGFWEFGLHPWDTAAGWVVVEEAGGRVTRADGGPFDNRCDNLLCSNGLIHDEMAAVIR